MVRSRVRILAVLLGILLAGSLAAAVLYPSSSEIVKSCCIQAPENKDLPVLKKAGDFELLNQDGEKIPFSRFHDVVKIVSFIFIKCSMPTMCPLTTKNLRRLQKLLDEDLGREVVLLSITFDPESDTPAALKRYGELYGADFSNWHFLTGSLPAIDRVCEDYEIIHEKTDGDLIRHSVITFLIDGADNVRKMYFANKWKPEDLKQDIVALLGEAERHVPPTDR
ncbi:MAG: SCO family protein [bacterium]|nr:SCO family protein [bacterium]